jgi:hypothetical protein
MPPPLPLGLVPLAEKLEGLDELPDLASTFRSLGLHQLLVDSVLDRNASSQFLTLGSVDELIVRVFPRLFH